MGHERKNGIVGTRGGRGRARRLRADRSCGPCTRPDEATTLRESVEAKCALLSVPGLEVEFDPEEAEQCGAFMENALSEEEAVDASQDVISY